MRGKEGEDYESKADDRITPAYAGKSVAQKRSYLFVQDHPRLCGEKLPGGRTTSKNMGSPPPMRGKVKTPLVKTTHFRITPAYAGKSSAQVIHIVKS